jgi:hypothetical protein
MKALLTVNKKRKDTEKDSTIFDYLSTIFSHTRYKNVWIESANDYYDIRLRTDAQDECFEDITHNFSVEGIVCAYNFLLYDEYMDADMRGDKKISKGQHEAIYGYLFLMDNRFVYESGDSIGAGFDGPNQGYLAKEKVT